MADLTDEGVALIKSDEGLRFKAYPDPGTGGAPWTIGCGHTGPEVHEGLVWTQEQCDAAFLQDIEKFQGGVDDAIGDAPTTDNQYSAMVSLSYNIGLGNFEKSSVLRLHKAQQYGEAADAFLLWNKAAGLVLPGLVRRRGEERAMYLGA